MKKSISESFYLYGTKFTSLSKGNIINDACLQVKDAAGLVYINLGTDYEINFEKGAIKRTDNSSLLEATEYFITFRNYSIYQSLVVKRMRILTQYLMGFY